MPDQFMPHRKNPQAICTVALSKNGRYSLLVAANSATGFGDPDRKGAQAPPLRLQALFLCPHSYFMVAVRGRPSGLPVTRFRFANLRTAAT